MKKILIIQTAFIGDVVLATVLIEKLADLYPDADIDFLVRSGNNSLLKNNPHLNEVLIWEKKRKKYLNLFKILFKIRKKKFDLIVNVHRFGSSGFLCWLSRANTKVGFDKNPFSFSYDVKVTHEIGNGKHEVERNLELLDSFGGEKNYKPRLYYTEDNAIRAAEFVNGPYVVIAPASVWFTKQFPQEKWVELIDRIPEHISICLLGAGNDVCNCEELINKSGRQNMVNLAGKLSFLESAALMKNAEMNFVNDSAPLHFASSVNAKTTAIFCSTLPSFGFGPLSDDSRILEIQEELDCRPCGLHGLNKCPKGHFKCAMNIKIPEEVV